MDENSKEVKMPKIVEALVNQLRIVHPNVNTKVLLNIVLAKLAQMITMKRVKCGLIEQKVYPNHYSIIFMPSGYGKDLITKELDDIVFKDMALWFRSKASTYMQQIEEEIKFKADQEFPGDKQKHKKEQYIKEEIKKIRYLPSEVCKGTPEGLFADALAFQQAGFGTLMVKYSEFGLLLKNAKNEDERVIQSLFELYDGKLSSKSIKTENHCTEVSDVPCVALLYSDPTLFARELKRMFESLMQTGLGRRATISYLSEQKLIIETNPDIAFENKKRFVKEVEMLGKDLFSVFLQIEENSVYEVNETTYKKVFHPYRVKLNELANSEENQLVQKELRSRDFKAQKISCLFAILNHVNDLNIHPEDMEQAISVVNLLGEDFKKFIKIRPVYKELYDKVFDFFKENLGKEFSATELKRVHYKNFGCGRKTFDRDFEEIIGYVKEIANEKGYLFNIVNIQPSGTKYSLTKISSEKLSDKVRPLTQLIGGSD